MDAAIAQTNLLKPIPYGNTARHVFCAYASDLDYGGKMRNEYAEETR